MTEKFLLDANSFITPYRQYYAFDLIAAAAVNKYTLITVEVSSGGLSTKTPNRYAKIPDVANAPGVTTSDLYYMMRQLGIKI